MQTDGSEPPASDVFDQNGRVRSHVAVPACKTTLTVLAQVSESRKRSQAWP